MLDLFGKVVERNAFVYALRYITIYYYFLVYIMFSGWILLCFIKYANFGYLFFFKSIVCVLEQILFFFNNSKITDRNFELLKLRTYSSSTLNIWAFKFIVFKCNLFHRNYERLLSISNKMIEYQKRSTFSPSNLQLRSNSNQSFVFKYNSWKRNENKHCFWFLRIYPFTTTFKKSQMHY